MQQIVVGAETNSAAAANGGGIEPRTSQILSVVNYFNAPTMGRELVLSFPLTNGFSGRVS